MAGIARRPGLPIRRPPETTLFSSSTAGPSKSRISPIVSLCFLLVVCTAFLPVCPVLNLFCSGISTVHSQACDDIPVMAKEENVREYLGWFF
jgi:hypothetical protein